MGIEPKLFKEYYHLYPIFASLDCRALISGARNGPLINRFQHHHGRVPAQIGGCVKGH
jgi:hypothetical protein